MRIVHQSKSCSHVHKSGAVFFFTLLSLEALLYFQAGFGGRAAAGML